MVCYLYLIGLGLVRFSLHDEDGGILHKFGVVSYTLFLRFALLHCMLD